jgi:hypothetical protein
MTMKTNSANRPNEGKQNTPNNPNNPNPGQQEPIGGMAGLGDRAKEVAAAMSHQAEGAANFIGQKADSTTAAVGEGLKSMGSTIREKTPKSGVLGEASAAVADTLESSGRYIQEEGVKGMAGDLTNMIRKNPLPAVLIGVGIGFLLARVTSTRS